MAADCGSNNANVGNGNIPTPVQPASSTSATTNFLIAIMLTIYDVIEFLAISIGYIFQVRKFKKKKHIEYLWTKIMAGISVSNKIHLWRQQKYADKREKKIFIAS